MRSLDWVLVLVAILGAGSSLRWYIELYRWATRCNHGRIVIAYKRRVVWDAPITEWLAYCNMSARDDATSGRTVYALGGTRVAVIKPRRPTGRARQAIRQAIRAGRRRQAPPGPVAGEFSVRQDRA